MKGLIRGAQESKLGINIIFSVERALKTLKSKIIFSQ